MGLCIFRCILIRFERKSKWGNTVYVLKVICLPFGNYFTFICCYYYCCYNFVLSFVQEAQECIRGSSCPLPSQQSSEVGLAETD